MPNKAARTEPQEAEPATTSAGAGADIIYLPDERQRRKKVTSGSDKRQRTKAIRVRVSPADLERLKTEAAAAHMSVAGYLASGRLAEEKTSRPRITRRRQTVEAAALMDAMVAFSRAMNNQNQIARALNELVLIAREQSSMRLESQVDALAEAICGMPALFAEPVAEIKMALNRDREG